MKAEEKKQIYNLLKTVSKAVNGYTSNAFSIEDPVFTDDLDDKVNAESFTDNQTHSQTQDKPQTQSSVNINPSVEEKKSVSLSAVSDKIHECTRCRLCQTRTNTVPGTGVEHPLVLVIGEGPGQDEDIQGLPFVGKAGVLLDKMLQAISLSRKQNCYIANIVKCRPPQNRDPQPDEIQACISFLDAQITLLKPKMILLMGRIAAQTLYKTAAGINSLRGDFYQYNGIPVMATYHPSALLRNEALKAPAWQDLKKFRSELLKLAPEYESSFVKE